MFCAGGARNLLERWTDGFVHGRVSFWNPIQVSVYLGVAAD